MRKVKIEFKDFFIRSYFQFADAKISSHLGYRWHEYLESHYFEYQKIADIVEDDILKNIRDGKKFFEKWKHGEIEFDNYINNYVMNESKKKKLVDLKDKIKQTHSSKESADLQTEICNIISAIEGC
jgi:hypothetical protein